MLPSARGIIIEFPADKELIFHPFDGDYCSLFKPRHD